jgi:hypothetical protein
MMKELIRSTTMPTVRMTHLSSEQRELLPLAIGEFLDTAATATARATFYNTRAEQEAAIEAVHCDLFALDRGIYTAALLLPGVTDFSRQIGAIRLLRTAQSGGLLSPEQEGAAVRGLLRMLPAQRMIKMFGMLCTERINNARTRRLILSTLLGADNLEFWAVKYRRKLGTALIHAWGRRTASIVRAVLAKPNDDRTERERQIVQRHLHRFGREVDRDRREQCVRFILGDEDGLTLHRLAAYRDAKRDLTTGRVLPYETLEGLRGRFHRDRTSAEVLELTKSQLTTGQKIGMQRKAAESDVAVDFDPGKYDAVRLYVYAYEMGLSEAIRAELLRKARDTAGRLPVRFEHAGILLDVSASMVGHETQARRPISVALALRDLLAETAERATIVTTDGRLAPVAKLIEPAGDTSLAAGLVALLGREPDVVFVLTDGYENAPAGRFAEVVRAVRRMGVETPIHQFSPVFAAETRGIRSLCEAVPGLPVSKPEAIGLGLLKVLFEADVDRGASALLGMVRPAIEGKRDARCIEEVKHGVS